MGETIMEELPLFMQRDGSDVRKFRTDFCTKINEETRTKIFKMYDPVDNIKALTQEQFEMWKGTDSSSTAWFWDVFYKTDDVSRAQRIFGKNSAPVWANGRAYGLYNEMSFLNHSCDANAFQSQEEMKKLKLKLKALKNIEKNEEIVTNYFRNRDEFKNGTKESRRQKLLETYGFNCLCSVCLEGQAPKPMYQMQWVSRLGSKEEEALEKMMAGHLDSQG